MPEMLSITKNSLFLAALLAAVFVSYLKITFAANCPSPPWLINRVRPLSTPKKTISTRIGSNLESNAALGSLLKHFRSLEYQKRSGRYACQRNPIADRLVRDAGVIVKHLGLGSLKGCLTSIENDGYNRTSLDYSKSIFQIINAFVAAVESLAPKSLPGYGLFWNTTFSPDLYFYRAPGKLKCDVSTSLAYRINGKWGVEAVLTNYTHEDLAPTNKTGYFWEVISLDRSSNPIPMQYSIPICSNGTLTSMENGSAALASSGGLPFWPIFTYRSLSKNPALRIALELFDDEQIAEELVKTSESVSNMAILLLPVILAVVHLGLFQDVSLSITLVYTLATDIISVLPAAIKGIELLFGDISTCGVASYLYGREGLPREELVIAQTWAAARRQDAGYKEKGIVLLSIASTAMVIGIVLEFATRAQVSKYRELQNHDLDLQNGDFPPAYGI